MAFAAFIQGHDHLWPVNIVVDLWGVALLLLLRRGCPLQNVFSQANIFGKVLDRLMGRFLPAFETQSVIFRFLPQLLIFFIVLLQIHDVKVNIAFVIRQSVRDGTRGSLERVHWQAAEIPDRNHENRRDHCHFRTSYDKIWQS